MSKEQELHNYEIFVGGVNFVQLPNLKSIQNGINLPTKSLDIAPNIHNYQNI